MIKSTLLLITTCFFIKTTNAQLFTLLASDGPNSHSVVAADFNGDGKSDLAVANYDSIHISVMLNNGTNHFATAVDFTSGASPISLTSTDFNGDNQPDLAVANCSGNDVSILINNGSGNFGTATHFAVGINPRYIINTDFNGDGKPDLAVANYSDSSVSVLLGNGTGGFGSAANFAIGASPVCLISADFNSDGKADLAVANNNNISVMLGNGSGGFNNITNYTVGSSVNFITSADFNRDGKTDLAVANGNNVSTLIGTGTGGFNTALNYTVSSSLISITSSDFNGDGKPDIAGVNNSNPSNVYVIIGNGAGGFGSPSNVGIGSYAESIICADFTGDNLPDLAVATRNSKVAILKHTPLCTITIPDANFRAALLSNPSINTNGDGVIACSEASSFNGTINVNGNNITDLTGINSFIALTGLNCANNQLTSLNVSSNTGIISLNCSQNQLQSLSLSANTALTNLDCSVNLLTSLNLKNGNNTHVTNFNATGNANLTCIQVDTASYSTLHWANVDATAAFSSNCSSFCAVSIPDANFKTALVNNPSINTNGNSAIECAEAAAYSGSINVSGLNISSLSGLASFTGLTSLNCSGNQLTSLNVISNTALISLYCNNNQLSSLNISQNTNTTFTSLNCSNNQLANLNLSANTALTYLNCSHNILTGLVLNNGNNTNLTSFSALNNPGLGCIYVDNVSFMNTNWPNAINGSESFCAPCTIAIPNTNFLTALLNTPSINTNGNGQIDCLEAAATDSINVSGKNINNLTGIASFPSLVYLNCASNQLTSLDLSANTTLQTMICATNYLSNLTLPASASLTTLWCYSNTLSSLSVNSNTGLKFLDCSGNYLSSLNVSNNPALISLACINNAITSLDASNHTALHGLFTYNNPMTSLNVTGDSVLNTLNCFYNHLSSLDVSTNTALATLNCYNNYLTSLDVKNGNNTNITTFNATGNPNLNCIQVDNAAFSNGNLNWFKDAAASYSGDCSCANPASVSDSLFKDTSQPYTWYAIPTYSANITSAKWSWGDGTETIGLYPGHTYASAGIYNVCVTAYAFCGDSATTCNNDSIYKTSNNNITIQINVVQDVPTSGQQIRYNGTPFTIYPNPAVNELTIANISHTTILRLYDARGKLIIEKETDSDITIDTKSLTQGVYILSTDDGINKTFNKVIITNY